ncbi:carboxypeptidase regulatory-like domain-containing protein [Methanobrevibacter filiformis]|uniref:DUF11 domain-containing protein n=1 Tax=Methanobrevibacter filiformis TaxID=55758 RepID=A0A162FAS5_9EURY|nr:carboxypeptidase regulatory-like domain-containing protein [Methanobrevibacter filiformis]KZX10355.1 hypothetical protein MBFIL_17860 [Methanobrevibacter filiformis]
MSFNGISLNSTLVINPILDTKVNSSVSINGTLLDGSGVPISGVIVDLVVNGVSYNTTTDANGKWNITYLVNSTGVINVEAVFSGNSNYTACVNTTHFNGATSNSTLIINPILDNKLGSSVSINGTLFDENNSGIANVTVVVTVNGVSYNTTTDANGNWSIDYLVGSSGLINVVAIFYGDNNHAGAGNETSFDGVPLNSTLIINPITDVKVNSSVNINGTLLDENNSGISNVTVVVTVNGVSYNLTTDVNGKWSIDYLVGSSGVINVVAVFDGNDKYLSAVNSTSFLVTNYVNVSVLKVSNVTGYVNVGDNVTYTITVTNYGLTNATGVFVTDKLNTTMLSFVSSSANRGAYDSNTGIWTIGDLGAGETLVLNITVTVIGKGAIVNVANVTADQNNTDNGTGNSTINVKSDTNLSASIPDAKIGDTVNITLNLTDLDGNPVNTVANVTIDGILYPDVEFINGIAKVPYNVTEAQKNITVKFEGNDKYNPSNDTVGVNFTKKDANINIHVPDTKIGHNATTTITLRDADGKPISNASVKVILNDKVIGTFITDNNGQIHPVISVNQDNILKAEFSGNDEYNFVEKITNFKGNSSNNNTNNSNNNTNNSNNSNNNTNNSNNNNNSNNTNNSNNANNNGNGDNDSNNNSHELVGSNINMKKTGVSLVIIMGLILVLSLFGLILLNKLRNKGSYKMSNSNVNNNSKNSVFKIAIVISLIAILFVSVSSVSAIDVTISTTNATGINGTLNNVTRGVDINNSITLSAGVYNKTVDRGNTISFSNKSLSICGNGAPSEVIIDGNNAGRLFTISGSNNNISFENIMFSKGKADVAGAAFSITGNSTVIFKNCIFTSNIANGSYGYGGAIYNTGSNLTLNNSIFTNNGLNISYNGTNSYGAGGAIYSTVNLTVINSIFTNNSINLIMNGARSDAEGGAIYSTVNLTVKNSTFTNNGITLIMLRGGVCYGYGGVIHNRDGSSDITNSSFSNNHMNLTNALSYLAAARGGIIYNTGSFSMSNSNFANNTLNSTDFDEGGVIYNMGSFSLSSSNFANNTSHFLNSITCGGVILNGGNFSVSGSNFTNNGVNSAYGVGGVIASGGNFSVSGSNFMGNSLNGNTSQGGLILNGGNFSVSGSNFTSNGVNCSSGYGGLILNDGNFSVSGSNFTGNGVNCSSGYGGLILNNGYGNFSVSGSNFTGNGMNCSIRGFGGVIFNNLHVYRYDNYYYSGSFSVSGSNFTGNGVNCSSGFGGVIFNDGNFSVSGSNFTGNGVNCSSGFGGVIFNNNSYFYIYEDNDRYDNSSLLGNFSVSGSNFIGNGVNCSSGGFGGAISNCQGDVVVVTSSFINNSASYGGGIYSNGSLVVNVSNFTGNTQAIGINTTNFTLNNNNILNNNLSIQFMYDNINYTLTNLTANGTIIKNNNYTYDICGNNSTYVILKGSVFDTAYKGFIIINGNNNAIHNSNISNISNTAITINTTSFGNAFINLTLSNNSLAIHFLGNNNIFTNGTLDGNKIGAIIGGLNNTIISATIVNNRVIGVNITGTSNNLNYNRLYNNTLGLLNSGTNTNANFNWWGLNNITSQYTNTGVNFNLTYWYVLELSLNNTFNTTVNATRNYSKNIPANLSYTLALNNMTNNPTNDPDLLPYFTVNLLIRNSTSVVNNVSGDIRTFIFSEEVMLTGTNLQESINALVDGEDLVLIIENGTIVNLSIVKVASVATISNNDAIEFIINITNNGTEFASNVTFTDILPVNFKFINVSRGSYNTTTGIWTVGNIGPKVTITLVMTAQAIKSGTVNNTANNVTAIETLTNPNINSTVTITIISALNLDITKVSNVTGLNNLRIGDHVKYIITVKNNGLDNASNVRVYDVLNSKLTFLTYNSSTGTYNNTTGLWNVGTLNANQTATLEIEVIIANNGTIENIANITANELIFNGSNTSANTTIYVGSSNTTLLINPIVDTKVNTSVNINGTLLDGNGLPISGVTVVVTVNGVNYNATTDASGNWNISYLVNSTGLINVEALFNGNSNYTGAVNSTSFNGLALNSTLIINPIGDTKVNSSVSINGTLLDGNGLPIGGVIVVVTVNGVNYNVTTDVSGNWNISYFVNSAGLINVEALFNGNSNYTGAVNSTSFSGVSLNSTLIINPIGDTKVNSSVSINGTLLDGNGLPIGGVIVVVIVNGVSYNVTTDVSGNWNISYLVNSTGLINVEALFNGNSNYAGAVNSTSFNGLALNSTLIINPIGDTKVNTSVSINGTLLDGNGLPIGGVIVVVTVNGVNYNVTTDVSGNWNISYLVNSTGVINVVAEFAGNNNYTGAVNTTHFNGPILNSTLIINPILDTKVGSSVSINGTLFAENNNSIANVTVVVTVHGVNYNTTTDINGNWNINYLVGSSGLINVVAIFYGNNNYAGAGNETSFSGVPLNSTLIINPIVDAKVNSSVSINGSLLDENGAPISGVTVNLIVNNVSYSATTGVSGNWNITYHVGSTGVINVVAEFIGNANYTSSANTTHFNGLALNSTLVINPIPDTKINSSVSINGSLLDESNKAISDVTVVVTVNGVNYNATTDTSGKWSITYLVNSSGNINVVAEFTGNVNYSAAVNSTNFNGVSLNSTLVINPVTNTKVNSSVSINGSLFDENGAPISDVTVVVTVNGVNYNATTDSSGKWNISYLVNSSGNINVVAEFTGNANYFAAVNSTSFVVTNYVNVSVVKVSNVTGYVNVGDNVTYTITATNYGVSNATHVFVTDKLNTTMLSFVSSSANRGHYDSNAGIWTIGNLNAGETVVLNITVTVIASGTIVNVANVTMDQNNTDNANGTSNSTINVKYDTHLNASIPDAKVGDTVNITLNLTDLDGNPVSTVANVTVDGVLYPNVEFLNGITKVPYNITEIKKNITVKFEGNNKYNPSNDIVGVNFTKKDANIHIHIPDTKIGHNATATITLRDAEGKPISNASIKVILNDKVIGTFITDKDGQIHPIISVSQDNNLKTEFSGNDEYNAAEKIINFKGNSSNTNNTNNTNNTDGTNNTNNTGTNNTNNTGTNNTDGTNNTNNTGTNNNTINNNTSNNNSHKVAGSNVSMKRTGVHLIAIILILSLFGSISIRKLKK